MNNLTKEQLSDLTARVNARLAEFGGMFEEAIPGVVRLTYDAIQEWTQGPAMPDLQGGADLFAEHPIAGLPEVEPLPAVEQPIMVSRMPVMVSPMVHEPAYIEEWPTNGNGHHAELSTAAVATLGPEHTAVTPLIPRRPRTLAEVDGVEDGGEARPTHPGARAKKELDEIRAKAAARAKLGEVSREQLVAELKRQAMAGTMPTMGQFDTAKPAVWPKAQMLTLRLGVGWMDLAREAGLKLVRR